MKRTLLLTGLMLMPLMVHAQTVDTSSQAGSQSTANSSSRSTANSGVAQGNTISAPVTTRSRATGGTATSQSRATGGTATSQSQGGQGGSSQVVVVNRVSSGRGGGAARNGTNGTNATDPAGANGANGTNATDPASQLGAPGLPLTETLQGTQTLRNTPEIVAPNIAGGNPCLVGISGGGAGPGIGITFGVGYSDRGCERRNSAALLSNMGEKDVAQELMCDDDHVRAAMLRTGHPCAADRAVAQPVAQNIDPAVIRREQATAASPPAPVAQLATIAAPPAKPPRPDWCLTASKAELRSHPQCD